MKKIIAALCLATVLVSCGNEQAPADNTDTTTAPVADANEVKDPICDMVNDGTWAEYSVSGTDTTWFCSETCKTTFVARTSDHDDHAGHSH